MKQAIIEANKALLKNEVPIGGIIVDNNSKKIISRAYNQINSLNNSINHCEISLIFKACKKISSKYLHNTSIFITLEPCTMCASAISESHISNVYFGAYDEKNGGLEKFKLALGRNRVFVPQYYGGIFEDECKKLLKEFFKNKRR